MALAYDTKAQAAVSANTSIELSYTCGANAKLLVVGVINQTTTARTGGNLTYNGVNMTQVGANVAGSAECNVELWYIVDPYVGGAANIVVPNSGAQSLRVDAASFTAAGSNTGNYHGTASANANSANANATINNVPAGGMAISVLGHGYKDPPTATSNTSLYANDEGAYITCFQYSLHASLANVTHYWTFAATDDVAMLMASFGEAVGTVQITPANTAHGQTVTEPTFGQTHIIVPANTVHLHSATEPTLLQTHLIGNPTNTEHPQSATEPALLQTHLFSPANTEHGQSATEPTVTEVTPNYYWEHEYWNANYWNPDYWYNAGIVSVGYNIVANDTEHGHTATIPELIQTHLVTAANTVHEHSATSPALSQTHLISANSTVHEHSATSPSLGQTHLLTPANTVHEHSATSPSLVQTYLFQPANTEHGHSATSPTLAQTHLVSPANCEHGHYATEPTLVVPGVIAPDNTEHVHTATSPSLGQLHLVTPANTEHGHTATQPTLLQTHLVLVQGGVHEHSATSPPLGQLHLVVPSNTVHEHTATTPIVTVPGVGLDEDFPFIGDAAIMGGF